MGLHDENIACKLLSEKDLTLDKAISIAQNMEAAGKEANEITVQTPNSVSIIKTPSKRSTPTLDPVHPVVQRTIGVLHVSIATLSAHAASAWVTWQECVGIDTNNTQGKPSTSIYQRTELMLSMQQKNLNTVQLFLLSAPAPQANLFLFLSNSMKNSKVAT